MKAISHRWVGVAILFSAILITTCGAARVVIPFTIDPANVTVPRDARALTSHEAAVRGLTAILVRVGLDTLANRRALATAGIRNHAALVAARLDLETLGNPRGFTVRHLKEGSLPTYQLAFLMADYLIERDGFDRVVAYFKSFERRQDRHSNFRDTFGQSLDQFEKEVLAHLKTIVRSSRPSSATCTVYLPRGGAA